MVYTFVSHFFPDLSDALSVEMHGKDPLAIPAQAFEMKIEQRFSQFMVFLVMAVFFNKRLRCGKQGIMPLLPSSFMEPDIPANRVQECRKRTGQDQFILPDLLKNDQQGFMKNILCLVGIPLMIAYQAFNLFIIRFVHIPDHIRIIPGNAFEYPFIRNMNHKAMQL